MNTILAQKAPKSTSIFECKLCDFLTYNKNHYNRHIETNKHKNRELLINTNEKAQKAQDDKLFFCECGKYYKHNPSLYNHRKKCNQNKNQEIILSNNEKNDDNYKDIIKTLLEQNNVVKLLLEQNNSLQNTIKDLIPKVGNNNNNNNTNNNFNICLFLNENCKDAISMDEFVKKIEITVNDLLFTKQKGLVNGISNIFIKNLNDLPEKERPIWCSDKKRKKLYIKEETWAEDINNNKTKQTIKDISSMQLKNINKYTHQNPDWKDDENKKEEYINIIKNTTNDIAGKEIDIINNLIDIIQFDKQKLIQ